MSTTRHQEKGTNVIHLKRSSKTPGTKTGLFATLRGALRLEGSGAPAPRLALAVALTTVSALAIMAAPAFAEVTHRYEAWITGPSSTASFSDPWSLSFDGSGDLFVADAGEARVDVFDQSNAPVAQVGSDVLSGRYNRSVTVSDSTGDVYVADSNHDEVFDFKPKGASPAAGYELLSQWQEPPFGSGCCFLHAAVDNHPVEPSDERAGDVYVLSSAGNVYVVKPEGAGEGKVVGEFAVAGTGSFDGLAVDRGNGDVYVAEPGTGVVEVFNSKGEEQPLLAITGSGTPGGAGSFTPISVAVDDADGVVYVVDQANKVVDEFSTAGTWLGEIKQTVPGEDLREPRDVAVQEHAGASQGEVYVSDGVAKVVDVFGAAPVVIPGVITVAASGVTPTSATLNGTVNPAELPISDCRFEYKSAEESSFTHSAACSPSPGSGSTAVAVSAAISGLNPVMTYSYRLSATSANGTSIGEELTFFTPGAPQVSNESAEVNPTQKAGQSTAILQGQVDPAGSETTYRFEYGETAAYGTSVPVPDGALGAGQEFQAVPAAELSGLKLGTVYHYRLVAHNQYGTAKGPDQEFSTLAAALLDASVSDVTATSATLEARIDPLGSETTYYFQYGAASCATSPASCTSIPVPPGDVGAGETEVQVPAISLGGLAAGTTYHYRVIASNSLGTVVGPEQVFMTQAQGTSTLPDGRQWELVSPVDKRGALLEPSGQEALTQASTSGEAISYLANLPTEADPAGNANLTQVLSTRGSTSWGSRDITIPREGPNGRYGEGEYQFFSQDLTTSILQPSGSFTPYLSPEASEQTSYLRTDYSSGEPTSICTISCYRPLVTGKPGVANVPPGTSFGEEGLCPAAKPICGPTFQGASPDGSHVVLSSRSPLTQGAAPKSLYEWADGQLQIVNVLPQGEGGGIAEEGGVLGSGRFIHRVWRNAVSTDGSRVVWSTPFGLRRLYLRDLRRQETVRLTAGVGGEPEYQAASADGGRVFFTQGGELYVFESTPGAALSAGHTTELTSGGKVIGFVAGISEDGATVYFVGNGVLTDTPNAQGETAVAGACSDGIQSGGTGGLCNLYALRAGVTRLVAVLSGEDKSVWLGTLEELGWARASGNGQWMTFMSTRSLTGYDNRDAVSGVRDTEVFLYNAAGDRGSGQLVCVSCNPTNARPHGMFDTSAGGHLRLADADQGWEGHTIGGILPGWTSHLYQPRYLSDSGRVLFDSFDALVPSDTNNTGDVYEYEPPGVGGCAGEDASFVASESGCVGLLSSGTGGEAAFLDASESGDDVFFLSPAQLAPQDVDTNLDVYDARVAGGFPQPTPVPACEGDACQSMVAAPNDATPGSLVFRGPGNLQPPALATAPKKATKRTAAQVRIERLAKALRLCRKKRGRKRAACERQAHKKYGVSHASRATTNRRAGR